MFTVVPRNEGGSWRKKGGDNKWGGKAIKNIRGRVPFPLRKESSPYNGGRRYATQTVPSVPVVSCLETPVSCGLNSHIFSMAMLGFVLFLLRTACLCLTAGVFVGVHMCVCVCVEAAEGAGRTASGRAASEQAPAARAVAEYIRESRCAVPPARHCARLCLSLPPAMPAPRTAGSTPAPAAPTGGQ